MHPKLGSFLLFVIFVAFSDARKAKDKPVPLTYNADVGNGDVFQMSVRNTSTSYTLTCNDKSLAKKGYDKAVVHFDYKGAEGVLVLSTGKGKTATCFYMAAALSEADFQAKMEAQLDTDVVFGVARELDGTGAPKKTKEARAWLKSVRSVLHMCKKSKIVEMSVLSGDTNLTDTKNVTVLGLDSEVVVVVNDAKGDKGDGGKGDKGTGGKGKGDKGTGGKGKGDKGTGGKGKGDKGTGGKGNGDKGTGGKGKGDKGTGGKGKGDKGTGGKGKGDKGTGGKGKGDKGTGGKGNGGKGNARPAINALRPLPGSGLTIIDPNTVMKPQARSNSDTGDNGKDAGKAKKGKGNSGKGKSGKGKGDKKKKSDGKAESKSKGNNGGKVKKNSGKGKNGGKGKVNDKRTTPVQRQTTTQAPVSG